MLPSPKAIKAFHVAVGSDGQLTGFDTDKSQLIEQSCYAAMHLGNSIGPSD
jgi:hypothetical protein